MTAENPANVIIKPANVYKRVAPLTSTYCSTYRHRVIDPVTLLEMAESICDRRILDLIVAAGIVNFGVPKLCTQQDIRSTVARSALSGSHVRELEEIQRALLGVTKEQIEALVLCMPSSLLRRNSWVRIHQVT